jgi:hypothetical protein
MGPSMSKARFRFLDGFLCLLCSRLREVLLIGSQFASYALRALMERIAALFVMPKGPYSGLPGVDLWDVERDARLYTGPYRVVAHPPCERWGRYWHGGPSARVRRVKGDDAGCFRAALNAVRKWGGVLEHPASSAAWEAFGLNKPPRSGGWINADFDGGWTCCVDQGNYGHRAQKATWLYAVGVRLPALIWGKSACTVRLDDGFHSAEERRRAIRTGMRQRLSHRQRLETPIQFRDLLLSIARTPEIRRAAVGHAG